MLVVPAVNEKTFEKVKERFQEALKLVEGLSEDERWVHIDVTNGTFTENSYWHNVHELPELRKLADVVEAKIEIHLMVLRPEWLLGEWLKAGAHRVIIHHEAMEFQDNPILLGDAVVIGVGPETSAEKLLECATYAKQVLLLAVPPGLSGQSFDEGTIEKIRVLRKSLPDVKIEIDGGVNKETANRVKDAGAHMVATASYIWTHENPQEAFETLRDL